MPYDYSKLFGRMAEKGFTQKSLAKEMGKSERTINLKLNGKIAWTQPEMASACSILSIPMCDAHVYFFTEKVQVN